jgi:hypothetical protein
MIYASVASPRYPFPSLSRIYQDQNEDTLTDYLPLHLGNPSIYRHERNNHHDKMRDMVEGMAP